MYLVVGLGNPGREYAGTRHNVGFEVVNKLAYDNGIDIGRIKRRAQIGEGRIGADKCVLIKPVTYMNLSGEAVRENVGFYKVDMSRVIVVYDDTDIDVGEIRIRKQGSAGGHNGMKNIIYQMETDEFVRVRVGIGEKPKNWVLADYVLSKFKTGEIDAVVEGIVKAGDAVEMIVREGVDAAMNKFNTKRKRSEEID